MGVLVDGYMNGIVEYLCVSKYVKVEILFKVIMLFFFLRFRGWFCLCIIGKDNNFFLVFCVDRVSVILRRVKVSWRFVSVSIIIVVDDDWYEVFVIERWCFRLDMMCEIL